MTKNLNKGDLIIDLKDDQLQDIIQSILNKDEGLNELLELILNGLMKIERTQWMASNSGPDNKSNGYRPGQAIGHGRKLSLRIPRDRLGKFQPVFWAMLRDQHEEVRRLCFELYGKGLSASEVGQVTEKIYGQAYSSSAISNFTQSQRRAKRRKFRRQSGIEAIIGHLKTDHRLGQNYLHGSQSPQINAMLAATGWNLKKWMQQAHKKIKNAIFRWSEGSQSFAYFTIN
ncbi:MAG: transposase [Bacteroidales bacterium]